MKFNQAPAQRQLEDHLKRLEKTHLRDLFAADEGRFDRFSFMLDQLLVDFSKQRIDTETIRLLVDLAEQLGLPQAIEDLFTGKKINESEGRAALHTALRYRGDEPVYLDGSDVMPGVREGQARMAAFADQVRSGQWRGYSGEPIRDLVNIGIGGSDLGPRMVIKALSSIGHPTLDVHCVANVDSADIAPLLETLDPRSTLFIITSKTFTTQETMTNAETARNWLLAQIGDDCNVRQQAVASQFVAVSTAAERVAAFGIAPDNIFGFRDWVGGRFSLWSPVGLSIAVAIGNDGFDQLLAGAASMDTHFRHAKFTENIPVLQALIGIWNSNFLGAPTYNLAPYSESLTLFPAYLQQLEMESNGKRIGKDGQKIEWPASPIVWGGAGTNAQHAYFQLLHQGERLSPVDFIALAQSDYPLPGHHPKLLANCFAQSEAMAFGHTDADAQKTCPGNQPSTTIVLPRLDPYYLGMLIALYEHKTFVQGIVWGINSFDQWGVELGKKLAARLVEPLADYDAKLPAVDSSTAGLIRHCRKLHW